jgi:hypothetical protein
MVTGQGDEPRSRRTWIVVVPATLTLLTCVTLGTVGWYFLAVAVGYNCGMSGAQSGSCGTAAHLWTLAAGLGPWLLASIAVALLVRGLHRPAFRPIGAVTCCGLIPLAVGWFLLCGRLA